MVKASDWQLTDEPIPAPEEGQFLVAISHISLDPAMRGWMNAGPSYIEAVGIGDVMRAGAVGQVIESRHPGFEVGDHVYGIFGVQEHAVSDGAGVFKVDPAAAPLPAYLGTLGMTGLTAYFGMLDVGRMREGDTVVVSGAAGAVGSVAGQIAKIKGAGRVIGIAGGPEKCAWLTGELGFDEAIDYKRGDVAAALRTAAPAGVDVYFDNVGGEILDICLGQLAMRGRVVLCGAISLYNATGRPPGPSNVVNLIPRRGRMEGFIILDYIERFASAQLELAGWLGEGKLVHAEHVVKGLERAPEALNMLFTGANIGKVVVEL
jgi:NADPH-dependent curcumin reductase CurA